MRLTGVHPGARFAASCLRAFALQGYDEMANQYATLRSKFKELADRASNPEVKALAELIVRLAMECDHTDRKAQEAADKYRFLKR